MERSIQRDLWLEEAAERVALLGSKAQAIIDNAEDDERLTQGEFDSLWNMYFALWYRGGDIHYTEPEEIAQLEEDIEELQTAYDDLVYGR